MRYRPKRFRRKRNRYHKHNPWVLVLCLVLVGVFSAAVSVTVRLRRLFLEYAANLCEDSALLTINALMQEVVFEQPERYENLVLLERDNQNHITALRTNVLEIGRIKAELVTGLFTRLAPLEHTTVDVPLGSVFAPQYLSGMGPTVPMGLEALTQMEAEFISAFSSAGINQTRHNMIIEVHAGFRILTPLGGEDREIVTQYPVTDTVIVGTVPEHYTYVDDTRDGLLGKINDYAHSGDAGDSADSAAQPTLTPAPTP